VGFSAQSAHGVVYDFPISGDFGLCLDGCQRFPAEARKHLLPTLIRRDFRGFGAFAVPFDEPFASSGLKNRKAVVFTLFLEASKWY